MRRRFASSLALLLAAFAPARADWPAGGTDVATFWADNRVWYARIFDHPSGDLSVLGVGKGMSYHYYNVQRVLRTGGIAPGWPTSGADLNAEITGMSIRSQSFIVDGPGYFWRSRPGSTAGLQGISPTGSKLPAGGYYSVGTGGGLYVHAAPGPDGDVYVTKGSSRLLRLTRTGGFPFGWTSTGIALPGDSFGDNAVIADGHDGAVVFMSVGATSGLPTATRIDSNKVRHAGWPTAGLNLGSLAEGFAPNDAQLLPSGADHFIAVWTSDGGSGLRRLWLQRFGLDATLDPAWPAAGLEPLAPSVFSALTVLPDGSGGVYALQQAAGVPVATHISSGGTLIGAPMVNLLDSNAQYVPTYVHPPDGIPEHIIADATPNGGLLVGWGDARLSPTVSFRVRWLLSNLTPDPGKPDSGLVVLPNSPGTGNESMLAVHADGDDGAFVAWAGWRDPALGGPNGDLWMTRVSAAPTVGVGMSSPAEPRIALSSPRPNPARSSVSLDLTLPDAAPVRVELLDLTGRRLRVQSVQGAGTHRLDFADLQRLPPGLYFVRASGPAGSRAVRVALGR